MVLDEVAGFVKLRDNCGFIDAGSRGEINIVGKSGVGEVSFPEAIAALEDQDVSQGCCRVDAS